MIILFVLVILVITKNNILKQSIIIIMIEIETTNTYRSKPNCWNRGRKIFINGRKISIEKNMLFLKVYPSYYLLILLIILFYLFVQCDRSYSFTDDLNASNMDYYNMVPLNSMYNHPSHSLIDKHLFTNHIFNGMERGSTTTIFLCQFK